MYTIKITTFTNENWLDFLHSTAVIGDFSGKYLAEYQPEKLAARMAF